jgi:hypothetical protein
MAYFLTDQQEYELNLFLDEQNRIAYHKQMESDEVSDELKDIIKKTEEAGSPIPAFDPQYGYYSVSFTPCNEGNRIYVHHHITNQSKSIYDPANNVEIINDTVVVEEPEIDETKNVITEDFSEITDFDDVLDTLIPTQEENIDELSQKLTSIIGTPPEELLQLQSE